MSAAAREHLRECERCRALLASFAEERSVAATIDGSAAAAEAAVGSERKKILAQRGVAIFVAILLFIAFLGIPFLRRGTPGMTLGEAAIIVSVGVFIAILVGAPILLLFQAIATAKTPKGDRRFYKRLGPGRWLNGVCLGIAEAMGWNVSSVRIAFLILFWLKGVGFLIYIVCSLAMPVHPADRQYLLRFKIARAWRRLRHATPVAR